MSARRCPRVWEVEAVLDGCLSQADATSLERHLETCQECRAERRALVQLEALGSRMPSATNTPLRRRALHQSLLRRANGLSGGPTAKSWAVTRLGLALSAAVALLLAGVGSRWVPRSAPVATAAEPSFEVSSAPSTRWRIVEHGSAMRLACEAGSLSVAVHKLRPGQRFNISLPDGELEVRGTRFVIEVSEHHTQRLTVTEGRVALRLQNRPELLVSAGQRWTAAPEPDAIAPVVSPPPAESAASASPPLAVPARGNPAVAKVTPAASDRATVRAVSHPASDPAAVDSAVTDYTEAMAAFSRSDFGTAEQLFSKFELLYPQSSHREDVLFLRALCRSRRGDVAGARALAREYMRQYPGGFRAPDASRLATPDPER
jgi:TolA-binding protein